jgi:hypothetical protein
MKRSLAEGVVSGRESLEPDAARLSSATICPSSFSYPGMPIQYEAACAGC